MRFLTVAEFAALLRCDRKTVYEEIRLGRLPAVRLGRILRIPAGMVSLWEQGRVEPPERGPR